MHVVRSAAPETVSREPGRSTNTGTRRWAKTPAGVGERAFRRRCRIRRMAPEATDGSSAAASRAASLALPVVARSKRVAHKRAGRRIHQVSTLHVARGVAALEHRATARWPGPAPRPSTRRGRLVGDNREQHAAAAWQPRRIQVIGFPMRAIRAGQHRHRPTSGRHRCSPVSVAPVANTIVSSGPHAAPRDGPSMVSSVDDGPPAAGTFFNVEVVLDVAEPPPVGRGKHAPDVVPPSSGSARLERIQRPNEDLSARRY